MKKITREIDNKFIYSFEFEYDPDTIEFCRFMKRKFGYESFGYWHDKWRFTSVSVAHDIVSKYPDVIIPEDLENAITMYGLELAQDQLRVKKAFELKSAENSDLTINGIKGELYPYQKIGVEFFINNEGRAILADTMGCLSGDSIVCVNRGGNARKYTLQDMYIRFNGMSSKKNHNWKNPSYIRSYNENTKLFELNKVKKVLYKGEKNTITLNLKAGNKKYSINLTSDHEVMTANGWKEAGKLSIDKDRVLVNGVNKTFCKLCLDNTRHIKYKYSKFFGECRQCMYRFLRKNNNNKNNESVDKDGYILVSGLYFHPRSIKKNNHNGIRKHNLVMEAKLNNYSYNNWISVIKNNKIPSNAKFIDSKKYCVHHINGIKNDNRLSNLKMLTHSEHSRIEGLKYKFTHFKKTFCPQEAKIVSIIKNKKEPVYDIIMSDPHRNFIANGVVVHNCGKSIQALSYAVHTKQKKTLIICPASVKYSWEKEVKKWTKLKSIILDSKVELDIGTFNNHDIFIINFDILRRFMEPFLAFRFDCMVIDECHYIKNLRTIRTKYVIKLGRNIKSVIPMSGTPLLNRPVELFPILHIVDPKTWNNFYNFTKRYCNGHQDNFGWNVSGASNVEELQEKIGRYFLRRTKEQVLKELPPKVFNDIPLKLSPSDQKNYNMVEKEFVEYLKEIKNKTETEIKRTLMAEQLVKLGELRRLTTVGKIDTAKEIVSDIIDSGEKVLVFSVYNEPLEELQKFFGKQAVQIIGSTPQDQRGEVVERFQKDKSVKVFLGGMKSAGVGITLTAASHVLFIDYSWVPADHQQAADRCHRIGQEAESVTVHQMYALHTIDDYMREMLEGKKEIFEKLIEGKSIGQAQMSLTKDIINFYSSK